jgi:hypothetical protein
MPFRDLPEIQILPWPKLEHVEKVEDKLERSPIPYRELTAALSVLAVAFPANHLLEISAGRNSTSLASPKFVYVRSPLCMDTAREQLKRRGESGPLALPFCDFWICNCVFLIADLSLLPPERPRCFMVAAGENGRKICYAQ